MTPTGVRSAPSVLPPTPMPVVVPSSAAVRCLLPGLAVSPPKFAQTLWLALAGVGALELVRVLVTTAGAMLSTGSAG